MADSTRPVTGPWDDTPDKQSRDISLDLLERQLMSGDLTRPPGRRLKRFGKRRAGNRKYGYDNSEEIFFQPDISTGEA